MLEKTLESPLDCKEIQPVHSKDQSWVFFGRNDAKAETPVLWPPHGKSWLIGKVSEAGRDWGQEEKGTIKDEMAGWHHWLDGRESEWTPGDGDGQGGLACYDSWGRRESDTTEQLNWTELVPWQPEFGKEGAMWNFTFFSWPGTTDRDLIELTLVKILPFCQLLPVPECLPSAGSGVCGVSQQVST